MSFVHVLFSYKASESWLISYFILKFIREIFWVYCFHYPLLILLLFRMTTDTFLVNFTAAIASPQVLTNHQSPATCQLMVCWLWPGQRPWAGLNPAAASAASPSPATTSPTLLRPPRGRAMLEGARPSYSLHRQGWMTTESLSSTPLASSSPFPLEDICVLLTSLSPL